MRVTYFPRTWLKLSTLIAYFIKYSAMVLKSQLNLFLVSIVKVYKEGSLSDNPNYPELSVVPLTRLQNLGILNLDCHMVIIENIRAF